MLELSQNTGVKPEVINRFRREGRLAVQNTDYEPASLTCESCGAPLEQGRYCPQCMGKKPTAIQGSNLKQRGKSGSLRYSYKDNER